MKQAYTIRLEQALGEALQREADKRNVSFSRVCAEQLSALPSQIDDRFDRIERHLESVAGTIAALVEEVRRIVTARSGDWMLARFGLEHLPQEFLFGALNSFAKQVQELTPDQRQPFIKTGRELLARAQNGNGNGTIK